MSLTALVYNQIRDVVVWDAALLNTILLVGDRLHSYITNSITKDYLLFTDIPEMDSINGQIYLVNYSKSCAGEIFTESTNKLIS